MAGGKITENLDTLVQKIFDLGGDVTASAHGGLAEDEPPAEEFARAWHERVTTHDTMKNLAEMRNIIFKDIEDPNAKKLFIRVIIHTFAPFVSSLVTYQPFSEKEIERSEKAALSAASTKTSGKTDEDLEDGDSPDQLLIAGESITTVSNRLRKLIRDIVAASSQKTSLEAVRHTLASLFIVLACDMETHPDESAAAEEPQPSEGKKSLKDFIQGLKEASSSISTSPTAPAESGAGYSSIDGETTTATYPAFSLLDEETRILEVKKSPSQHPIIIAIQNLLVERSRVTEGQLEGAGESETSIIEKLTQAIDLLIAEEADDSGNATQINPQQIALLIRFLSTWFLPMQKRGNVPEISSNDLATVIWHDGTTLFDLQAAFIELDSLLPKKHTPEESSLKDDDGSGDDDRDAETVRLVEATQSHRNTAVTQNFVARIKTEIITKLNEILPEKPSTSQTPSSEEGKKPVYRYDLEAPTLADEWKYIISTHAALTAALLDIAFLYFSLNTIYTQTLPTLLNIFGKDKQPTLKWVFGALFGILGVINTANDITAIEPRKAPLKLLEILKDPINEIESIQYDILYQRFGDGKAFSDEEKREQVNKQFSKFQLRAGKAVTLLGCAAAIYSFFILASADAEFALPAPAGLYLIAQFIWSSTGALYYMLQALNLFLESTFLFSAVAFKPSLIGQCLLFILTNPIKFLFAFATGVMNTIYRTIASVFIDNFIWIPYGFLASVISNLDITAIITTSVSVALTRIIGGAKSSLPEIFNSELKEMVSILNKEGNTHINLESNNSIAYRWQLIKELKFYTPLATGMSVFWGFIVSVFSYYFLEPVLPTNYNFSISFIIASVAFLGSMYGFFNRQYLELQVATKHFNMHPEYWEENQIARRNIATKFRDPANKDYQNPRDQYVLFWVKKLGLQIIATAAVTWALQYLLTSWLPFDFAQSILISSFFALSLISMNIITVNFKSAIEFREQLAIKPDVLALDNDRLYERKVDAYKKANPGVANTLKTINGNSRIYRIALFFGFVEGLNSKYNLEFSHLQLLAVTVFLGAFIALSDFFYFEVNFLMYRFQYTMEKVGIVEKESRSNMFNLPDGATSWCGFLVKKTPIASSARRDLYHFTEGEMTPPKAEEAKVFA